MFCSNCGKEIEENARFCAYCGTKIEQNKQEIVEEEMKTEQAPVVLEEVKVEEKIAAAKEEVAEKKPFRKGVIFKMSPKRHKIEAFILTAFALGLAFASLFLTVLVTVLPPFNGMFDILNYLVASLNAWEVSAPSNVFTSLSLLGGLFAMVGITTLPVITNFAVCFIKNIIEIISSFFHLICFNKTYKKERKATLIQRKKKNMAWVKFTGRSAFFQWFMMTAAIVASVVWIFLVYAVLYTEGYAVGFLIHVAMNFEKPMWLIGLLFLVILFFVLFVIEMIVRARLKKLFSVKYLADDI